MVSLANISHWTYGALAQINLYFVFDVLFIIYINKCLYAFAINAWYFAMLFTFKAMHYLGLREKYSLDELKLRIMFFNNTCDRYDINFILDNLLANTKTTLRDVLIFLHLLRSTHIHIQNECIHTHFFGLNDWRFQWYFKLQDNERNDLRIKKQYILQNYRRCSTLSKIIQIHFNKQNNSTYCM